LHPDSQIAGRFNNSVIGHCDIFFDAIKLSNLEPDDPLSVEVGLRQVNETTIIDAVHQTLVQRIRPLIPETE